MSICLNGENLSSKPERTAISRGLFTQGTQREDHLGIMGDMGHPGHTEGGACKKSRMAEYMATPEILSSNTKRSYRGTTGRQLEEWTRNTTQTPWMGRRK